MVVLVVALIGAMAMAGVGGQIGERIRCAISSLGGGGGGGSCAAGGGDPEARPRTDADYEPKMCQISSVSDTAGGKVKIGWFEWGEEYGFQQKVSQANTDVDGDGKVDGNDRVVSMTFTDAASAGVTASTPGAKLGSLGKADVDIGGGIKITNGDTWIFASEEEAQKMRDDIAEMKMWETATKHGGGYGGNWYSGMKWAEKKQDIERKIGDKRISYSTVGLNAYADGGLSVKGGDEDELGAKVGGKARFSPEATIARDDVNGNESYTYTARLELEGRLSGNAAPLKGTVGAEQSRTGAITVTRDQKTGKLVRIDMTQTVEDVSTSGKVEVGGDNGESGADKRGGKGSVSDGSGGTGVQVVTNSLVFGKEADAKTEAQRAVAEQWLGGSGNNTAPFEYLFGDRGMETRPTGDDAFEHLMFEEGLSSTMRYLGETDAQDFGFEISLGMSLGFSVSTEQKSQSLADARFLGRRAGTAGRIFRTATARTDGDEGAIEDDERAFRRTAARGRAPVTGDGLSGPGPRAHPSLTGCGSGSGAGETGRVPEGWSTLHTGSLSVGYPKDQGYAEQPADERSRNNAAVALKVEDGIRTGMVSVQLDFATGVSDAAGAAAAAGAGIGLGTTRRSTEDVRLAGPSPPAKPAASTTTSRRTARRTPRTGAPR